MKKAIGLFVLILTALSSRSWAIPSQITYQGTIREKGILVNGGKKITFQLTDASGNTPYAKTITKDLTVANGLFSTQLSFELLSPNTWESITPYLKVSVEGLSLSPTEPVSATVYANVSNTVVDNAITPAKVASGYGLVPSGMVSMFTSNCPSGWSRFTALDGLFPVGGATYGVSGGSATHVHSISADGQHTHLTPAIPLGSAQYGTFATVYPTVPSPGWVPLYPGQTTNSAGLHNHGGVSGEGSSLPPYKSVVYCQKL